MTDSYVTYMRLLRRLHWLISENRDDTAEGDDLRDQMDVPWNQMTDFERDLTAKESDVFIQNLETQ